MLRLGNSLRHGALEDDRRPDGDGLRLGPVLQRGRDPVDEERPRGRRGGRALGRERNASVRA